MSETSYNNRWICPDFLQQAGQGRYKFKKGGLADMIHRILVLHQLTDCTLDMSETFFGQDNCSHYHVLGTMTYYLLQSWSLPFSCAGSSCSSTLQNNDMRPKMFCCFWSNTLELTPIVCSLSITDTDSVLCTFEDCYSAEHMKHLGYVTVQAVKTVARTHIRLLTYLLTKYECALGREDICNCEL